MLSIDGLVTGIDTASIIDGLLSIQQTQIDRFSARRQGIVEEQTAFKGIEARLLTLQGSISRLTRVGDNALESKQITVSDETAVEAAVSSEAVPGLYRFRVESLARAHQIASHGFASADAEIAQGTFDIRVGNGAVAEVIVTSDDEQNTLRGLAQLINEANAGVTASIIDDGANTDPFHLLLTANEPGAANTISLTFDPIAAGGLGSEPVFDFETPVQAARDATIYIGSGDGALKIVSESNQFDNLFPGITFDVRRAEGNEIELNVVKDIEAAETAVTEFVDSYNDVISYIKEQARFDPVTSTGSVLFGNRSVSTIQNELSQAVTSLVPGLEANRNRLSVLGITINADGLLSTNTRLLNETLNGQVNEFSTDDLRNLFGVHGLTDNPHFQFVLAGDKTKASPLVTIDGQSSLKPYQVKILQAAEQARVTGTNSLAANITINGSNNEFSITIDGKTSGSLTLAAGDYTPDELAIHLQQVIHDGQDRKGQSVAVAVESGKLAITSLQYGTASEIAIGSGSALASLGFVGGEADRGLDVVGHFVVDGEVESAVGRGRLLVGRAKEGEDPGATEGLQVRVTLTPSQVTADVTADITITRGIASRLGRAINAMIEPLGALSRIDNTFLTQIESVDESIDRLNAQFDARRESLLAQFARLESSVSELQSAGTLLSAQLVGLPQLS